MLIFLTSVLIISAPLAVSPLFKAVLDGEPMSVKKILEERSDEIDQQLPKDLSEEHGPIKVIRLLSGSTPLHAAAMNNRYLEAELLLSAGAAISLRNSYGFSPLHEAVRNESEEVVEILLDSGADPNEKVKVPNQSTVPISLRKHLEGQTPIQMAAATGNLKIAGLLFSQGAAIGTKSQMGMTALHAAASNARKDMLELLLSKGMDINVKNNEGVTPLHLAAENGLAVVGTNKGRLESLKLILSRGANPCACDSSGKTPADYAKRTGYIEALSLLITIPCPCEN